MLYDGNSLLQASKFGEDLPFHLQRKEVICVVGQTLIEGVQRFQQATKIEQGHAFIGPGAGVIGSQFNGSLGAAQGFRELLL